MHSTTTVDVLEIADRIASGRPVTLSEWAEAQAAVGLGPRMRARDEFDPPGSPTFLPSGPIHSDGAMLRAALAKVRRPDIRTVTGTTIDLDIWRNGPRPTADPCCSPSEATPCAACLEAPAVVVEPREPDAWGYGMPAWSLGPDQIEDAPADAAGDGPTTTFAGLVEWNIQAFRSLNSDAGDLMAEALGELLAEIRITQARTPGQLRDRRAALAPAG